MSIPVSETLATQSKHWKVRDFKAMRGSVTLAREIISYSCV